MKLWKWIAWSAGRDRICDCGTAWAKTAADAEAVGWMSLGGPWSDVVEKIEVRPVIGYNAPFAQVSV